MISRKHQCIYIHIPKTAGTSIETKFDYHGEEEKRGWQDHRSLKHLQQAIWPLSRGQYSPAAFVKYANQRYKAGKMGFEFVSESEYQSYFKFAIVRNPWDRVYSWYRNIIRDQIHQQELGIPTDCDFSTFLDRHIDNWALEPQLFWLRDESGNVGLDYVGKFEELEKAFEVIGNTLGLDDKSLPKKLDSGKSDYRSAYDEQGKRIVARKYAEEIELYHYVF